MERLQLQNSTNDTGFANSNDLTVEGRELTGELSEAGWVGNRASWPVATPSNAVLLQWTVAMEEYCPQMLPLLKKKKKTQILVSNLLMFYILATNFLHFKFYTG